MYGMPVCQLVSGGRPSVTRWWKTLDREHKCLPWPLDIMRRPLANLVPEQKLKKLPENAVTGNW